MGRERGPPADGRRFAALGDDGESLISSLDADELVRLARDPVMRRMSVSGTVVVMIERVIALSEPYDPAA